MNIRRIYLTFGAIVGLLLSGCGTTKVGLNSEQKEVLDQLVKIDPVSPELWKIQTNTAIIDIHTHTFNARYLPLEKIILGKRDVYFPVTTLITDKCGRNIARQIVNLTELDGVPGQCGVNPDRTTAEVRATGNPGLICKLLLNAIDKAVNKGAWDPKLTPQEQLAALDDVVTNMNFFQRQAIKAAAHMMGMESHLQFKSDNPDIVSSWQTTMRFLWLLTQSDAKLPDLYHEMNTNMLTTNLFITLPDGQVIKTVPCKGSITMISHTMDLGPVYNQPPDGCALVDFANQIERAEHYSIAKSNLYYFVAYCPYRDFTTSVKSHAALDMVKEAITKHHALGVKVYPPSGYRAAGNNIPSRPWAISRYPGEEWDARYKNMGANRKERNAALDGELNELLEWCIANDVPVLVHSGYGEFEARKGYGNHHSSPEFWERFLASHSTPGNPCKLRLCLCHAGGEDYWVGIHSRKPVDQFVSPRQSQGAWQQTTDYDDWGERAYRLCTTYPNVYCEVTTSAQMVERTTRAYFAWRLINKFEESQINSPDINGKYPFAKKLLYGTDWPLPDTGRPDAVLRNTQLLFLHPKLQHHYADYFHGNASRFLKLDTTINGRKEGDISKN